MEGEWRCRCTVVCLKVKPRACTTERTKPRTGRTRRRKFLLAPSHHGQVTANRCGTEKLNLNVADDKQACPDHDGERNKRNHSKKAIIGATQKSLQATRDSVGSNISQLLSSIQLPKTLDSI